MTTYEYDDDGRVVRAVTVVEPEWTDHERELLLDVLASPRGPHGFPMSEATSEDADPANPDAQFYFYADLPFTDFAARAEAQARERFREQLPEGASMAGYIFPVEKRQRLKRT